MIRKPGQGVAPRTAYHHGDLHAHLIASATALVELYGPDGFSVAEAARRAGVSTAAPYRHFKDRDAILRGVVAEAMDRLRRAMKASAGRFPAGSLEAVAALGQAYIDFAKTEPGVFRLTFGLTEGHEDAPELLEKGRDCFGVVIAAAAEYMGRPIETMEVQRAAYMLWCYVHGHSFLTIDQKRQTSVAEIDEWDLLMRVSGSVLGQADVT